MTCPSTSTSRAAIPHNIAHLYDTNNGTVTQICALWRHSWQSADGAFDDAADFNAHAVWGRQHLLAGIPLRIDCGAEDGFAPIMRALRASLTPTPASGIEPGGHDDAYWRSQAPAQLAFAAARLAG